MSNTPHPQIQPFLDWALRDEAELRPRHALGGMASVRCLARCHPVTGEMFMGGRLPVCPAFLPLEGDKDLLATKARVFVAACDAVAVTMCVESWMTHRADGEPLDDPAEAPDRTSVLFTLFEAEGQTPRAFTSPFDSSDNKGRRGVEWTELPGAEKVEGRFALLLKFIDLPADLLVQARTILATMVPPGWEPMYPR